MEGRRGLGLGLLQTRLKERLATLPIVADHPHVDDPTVRRDEIVALLFNVSDIAESLFRIEGLLKEGEDEEDDEG